MPDSGCCFEQGGHVGEGILREILWTVLWAILWKILWEILWKIWRRVINWCERISEIWNVQWMAIHS